MPDKRKRVLIITYYWPPSGGGGVMRWLKFSKYLPGFGWQPVIFTPENPDPSMVDESLVREVSPEAEIIKLPIWEPYDVYRKLTGKKKEEKFKAGYISEASGKGWKDRLSVFIRGNLMIPDPRKFWIRPATRYLLKYLAENPVDVIVTTGPPHSMHLIGLNLKRKTGTPWVADFRDPWTNIDFYHRLRLTKWADRRHHKMESRVLKAADEVVTVSWSWANDFEKIFPRKITVVTNGYDPEDFKFTDLKTDPEFCLTHIGSFNKDRNPVKLWEVLGKKVREDDIFRQKLKIRFVGQTDRSIFESMEESGLSAFVEDYGFVGHKRSIEILAQSQVLLLPLNDAPNIAGIIPGKLFEYLATGRPILLIGPDDGDSARIITETGAGMVAGLKDEGRTKEIIDNLFADFMKKGIPVAVRGAIERYSREQLAGVMAGIFARLDRHDN